MRLNCPKCGKPVPDGAAFCGGCGASMNQAAQPAPPPQPAQPVPPTQPAPPAYAQAPAPPGYAPPQPVAPAKSGTSCWLIGCVALLLIVLLGVGGYFGVQWWRNRGQTPPVVATQTGGGTAVAGNQGGVQSNDEDNARQLLMDAFSMWSQGDEDGIKAVSTPEMLDATEDFEFDLVYEQFGVKITSSRSPEANRWVFVVVETFDSGDGERTVAKYEVQVVKRNGAFLLSHMEGLEYSEGQSSGNNGGSQSSGGSSGGASTQSSGSIPGPMPTLNAFLADAGKGDGQAMARRMTQAARSEFGEIADMWGQGDWTHDSFEVISQDKNSETMWHFEVTETMRDWETNEPFYSTYGIDLQWSGSGWQVSEFFMGEPN